MVGEAVVESLFSYSEYFDIPQCLAVVNCSCELCHMHVITMLLLISLCRSIIVEGHLWNVLFFFFFFFLKILVFQKLTH